MSIYLGKVRLCEKCGESEEDKFSPSTFNICKNCRKEKSSKTYLCKFCGVSDESLFYEGRYGNCKKCYCKKKVDKVSIVKFIEDKHKEPEIKESFSDVEIKNYLRKILKFDTTIMEGLSFKQYMEDIKVENISLCSKLEEQEKINRIMGNKIDIIFSSVGDFNKFLEDVKMRHIQELEMFKKFYDKKFEEQAKQIEELRSLIMKNKEN